MLRQQFLDIKDGISKKDRGKIANSLAVIMADTYAVYLKTHNFHWNVTGPMFNTLHLMFEVQYNELFLAVDLIAERIRALGFIAPGSYAEFNKLTKIAEHTGDVKAVDMIKHLIVAHEQLIKNARSCLSIADEVNDQVSLDLMTQRLQIHEKTVWMLRSLVH